MQKFTKAKKFNDANVTKVADDKPVVYRLLNKNNKDVYVGIAKRYRGQDRLMEHLNLKKEKVPGAVKLKVLPVKNLGVAEKVEKKLIEQLSPKFNIQNK